MAQIKKLQKGGGISNTTPTPPIDTNSITYKGVNFYKN